MRLFSFAFLLAVVGIVNLSNLPSTLSCIVIFLLTLLLGFKFRSLRTACAGFVFACCMTFYAFYSVASHRLAHDQVSTDLTVTVRIDSVPQRAGRRLGFMAKLITCDSCSRPLNVKRMQLSWYGRSPELAAGDIWQMTVRLKPPGFLRNPGGFDAVAWALVRGIDAKGYVRQASDARKVSLGVMRTADSIRQNAAQRLQRLSTKLSASSTGTSTEFHQRYLGLVQALSVGLKADITDAQWDLLRSTGTAHLLAISGLHVGLVAAWVLMAGKLFLLCMRKLALLSAREKALPDLRIWILFGSLLAAIVYSMLAGFELPTQRAVLMLAVWLLASIRFRFLPPASALCIALVAVLSTNVLNPMSAGFWLSFGTVTTLFYLHQGHLRARTTNTSGRLQYRLSRLPGTIRTHCLLGLVLLPVGAWFFQSGSLLSPIANLVAVPWVAMVCVPLALMTLALSGVSDTLAASLLSLTVHTLHYLMVFLQQLHATQLSSIVLVMPGVLAFALSLAGLLIVLGPPGLQLRALALPLFLPAVVFNSLTPADDRFEVHFLDVGQGLAALVFAGNETLLFDTGGKISPQLSMFEAVVVPFLHASGRKRIDTLVVSHGDEDHAFGVPDVLSRYPDITVYSSQPLLSIASKPFRACQAGTHWLAGTVKFAFLHPDPVSRGSDNDRSCVLLAYSGNSRVLLTGDIEAAAEQNLVSKFGSDEIFPVTVMSAPHHGSRTSSSQEFIDKVRPQHVVFPAGARNRYGFPHSDVQLRYKLSGANVFVTGRDGSVSFALGIKGLVHPPVSWWHLHRRFWHGIVNPGCWQRFVDQSLVLRLLALSQKGQILCGK